ncbi:GTP 3',8-cyclase MoaA [Kordiimonas lacus]|uniref:GTP 3',8-cyclase n=1 Tax=Kordiimonas lacus TaxID=637679 RepID=A0A1G7A8W5_9PROT|nr:GTP 3',8-cyclase MoaA [Kordiimonas lacus]SDE11113.1 cyclic pyranopterin phosphate synthase [Kordiimonas lacus]
MRLSDGFGRTFKYLRLSVTEACNFKCSYCLPDGYRKCAGPQPLTVDELRRAATAFTELGLRKIRLTGGEPTVRKDFLEIAETIGALHGLEKLALTTNGYRLEHRAKAFFDAGISAINVSLDSLDPATFLKVTGHDRCDEVLRGIDAAFDAGFDSVKLNAVYLKGINDHELDAYLRLAKDRPLSVRFIELMETGDHPAYFQRHHIPATVIAEKLEREGWTKKLKAVDAGPANEYVHPDYRGSIGLIAPYSKDFCKSCNRLRFSSMGKLHLCLFGEFGVPMRALLQSDDQVEELKARLIKAVGQKVDGHQLAAGLTGQTSNLSSIGG